jgi:hypothetical protein
MRMMLHRQYCWKWMGKFRKIPDRSEEERKKMEKKSMFERLESVTIDGAIDVDTATVHGPPTTPGYRVPFLLQLFCQLFFYIY